MSYTPVGYLGTSPHVFAPSSGDTGQRRVVNYSDTDKEMSQLNGIIREYLSKGDDPPGGGSSFMGSMGIKDQVSVNVEVSNR